MNKNLKKEKIIVLLITILVTLIDQLSKLLVTKTLTFAKELKVIPNFFSLLYIENDGAAFSSFTGQQLFLVIISTVCIILIIRIIQKENYKNKYTKVILGMLLGGIIGNLIDRILRGVVIDFLSFKIIGYKFPVFNIADICITCGVVFYLIINLLEERSNNKLDKST